MKICFDVKKDFPKTRALNPSPAGSLPMHKSRMEASSVLPCEECAVTAKPGARGTCCRLMRNTGYFLFWSKYQYFVTGRTRYKPGSDKPSKTHVAAGNFRVHNCRQLGQDALTVRHLGSLIWRQDPRVDVARRTPQQPLFSAPVQVVREHHW